jgi:predicted dehydrogenase
MAKRRTSASSTRSRSRSRKRVASRAPSRGASGRASRGASRAASRRAARPAARPASGGAARRDRVRYAIVGAGYISQAAMLPAFARARRNSVLAAIVSDDPVKRDRLSRRHGAPVACGYDGYDTLLGSGAVDAVYIGLPNHLHADYVIRAAQAGVHVLCDKPLAVTQAGCRAIAAAVERAGVKLMVAYRLHFERASLEALKLVRAGRLGELRCFDSVFTMQVEPDNIRLRSETGGGTLHDIGIYCINAARTLFGAEPQQVVALSANTGEERFAEVDEMVSAILRFPGERLATFTVSFGAASTATWRLVGTRGDLVVDHAYEHASGMTHALTVKEQTQRRRFPKRDQFAAELLHFSDCILQDRQPEPSATEGLADVRVIEALYRSAEEGVPVELSPFERRRHPQPSQVLDVPAARGGPPPLVHADDPSPEPGEPGGEAEG